MEELIRRTDAIKILRIAYSQGRTPGARAHIADVLLTLKDPDRLPVASILKTRANAVRRNR